MLVEIIEINWDISVVDHGEKKIFKNQMREKNIQRCEEEDHSPKEKKEVQKSPLIYIILN